MAIRVMLRPHVDDIEGLSELIIEMTFDKKKTRRDLYFYGFYKECLVDVQMIENARYLDNTSKKSKYNSSLGYACEGGNIELINLMAEKGADWWNYGLRKACEGGHIDLVGPLIKKGADNWNCGLLGACEGGHIAIVHLMLGYGANRLDYALIRARENGNQMIVDLLIKRGANL